MGEYRISDISVGMKESFSRTITADMMQKFFDVTGDENPLHTDKEFAIGKGFTDRVVYGMLTASLISTLGGVLHPRKILLNTGCRGKVCKAGFCR